MSASGAALTAEEEAFKKEMWGWYIGATAMYVVNVGVRTNLFDALADFGADGATADALAAKTRMKPRYVLEWCMAAAGNRIIEYSEETNAFSLASHKVKLLTSEGGLQDRAFSLLTTFLAPTLPKVVECFPEEGPAGVPYEEFHDFSEVHSQTSRTNHEVTLPEHVIPALLQHKESGPRIKRRLEEGCHVLDIGCGCGLASVNMSKLFPSSTFVGVDLLPESIAQAKAEAQAASLGGPRLAFHTLDVTTDHAHHVLTSALPSGSDGFALITAFMMVHDLGRPEPVLRSAWRLLEPGGVFLMEEMRGGDSVRERLGSPSSGYFHTVSLLHCMTQAMAQGGGHGTGLGTVVPESRFKRLLTQAGFRHIDVIEEPSKPFKSLYICVKEPEGRL